MIFSLFQKEIFWQFYKSVLFLKSPEVFSVIVGLTNCHLDNFSAGGSPLSEPLMNIFTFHEFGAPVTLILTLTVYKAKLLGAGHLRHQLVSMCFSSSVVYVLSHHVYFSLSFSLVSNAHVSFLSYLVKLKLD